MTNRPNFLFIMTDQQRADWLSCAGHPVLKTPNIDAIAATGTRFENFHATSPICMPNRASFMTGRYPTTHGLRSNGCWLSLRANTFVDVLAASGYHTAAIGKSHLQPMTGLPNFDEDLLAGPIAEAWRDDVGNYEQEEPDQYRDDMPYELQLPYYGYQHVDMVTDHGDRCGGHYRQWFKQKAPNWRELHDAANELPHSYSCPQAYRTPVPEALYPTAYVRDKAVDYLHGRATNDQPFFAFVSFPDPHHPFNPPGKYWDLYQPGDFSLPLPYEAHRNPTPPMRFVHDAWKSNANQLSPQTATMATEQHLKEAMALSAGMLAMIDDAVGDLVATLKETGLYDDTIICFTSDHGDYLGDFNLLLKGAMPFRSITRVPMIWSDPADRSARTTDALAATIDLPATILDRVGVPPYFGMQASSFLPVLNGEATEHKDALFIEYNDGGARLGFDTAARVKAVVTDRYRFTIYKGEDWGELYDLAEDPNETHNRWDDPAYAGVKADLSLRLNHLLADLMDESPRALRRG
jgi:arylsulfatase A-like enzyme